MEIYRRKIWIHLFLFIARQLFNKRDGLLSLDDVTEFRRVITKIKVNRDAPCWPHNSKEMTIINCLCTVSNVQSFVDKISQWHLITLQQTVFRICACADRFTAHSTIPQSNIYRDRGRVTYTSKGVSKLCTDVSRPLSVTNRAFRMILPASSSYTDYETNIKFLTLRLLMLYTGWNRRNVPDFGRVFLMLEYTDITQNTYIQSWTVWEIMAIENCGLPLVPER